MGSIAIENPVINGNININGDGENDEISANVNKLHNIVDKLAKENDLPSPTTQTLFSGQEMCRNDINADPYSLENTKEDYECDTDLESEDSWLFESPPKTKTPGQINKSPDKWLKDNITTPELMRVRGSLSAKLDVIAIENRKERMTDPVNRKRTKGMGENLNNVNSLDWDYDEDEDDFDPEDELRSFQGNNRQAWSEPSGRRQTDPNDPKPFSLDWSEDEDDDLVPMKIDFNSTVQRRKAAPNPTVTKRSSSGINNLATPRQAEVDYDELVAKPQGGVKPRRAVQPVARVPKPSDYEDEDFDDSAPVVPRGTAKPRALKAKKKTSFAEHILIHPIQKDHFEAPQKATTPQRLFNPRHSPSPKAVGIAKPVQRRKPDNSGDSGGVRVRSSASAGNLVRPRTSAPDMPDSSLKGKLPGDGAVIRRRGAPSPSEGIPTIQKSSGQPQIARVQGIPQVRKSTGSLPQKSEGIARPRTSPSATGMVRPRGSGMSSQSYQADY